ncbi:MAG: hypothetical protein GYA23_10365 [Methanomicrobiales archaeon]|nr:hypothetical protein [Methanomicrobiales archaeon]
MFDLLLFTIVLCLALFLFIIVLGENLYSLMIEEQVNYLRLIVSYAALPLPRDTGLLPEPVQRYLSFAGAGTCASAESVRMKYHGKARYGKKGRWLVLGGECAFSIAVPGFWWRATLAYLPGVWLDRFDYYVDHRAGMNLNLFSLIPLSNINNSEIVSPALFRYLSCTPLFPMVHAHCTFIQWHPVDNTAARAVITDGTVSAEALVRFDERGWMESMNCIHESSTTNGQPAPGLVSCLYSSYFDFNGYRIPEVTEAEFILPDGERFEAEYILDSIDFEPCITKIHGDGA